MSEYDEQAQRGSYQGGGGLGDLRRMTDPGDHTPPRNGSVLTRYANPRRRAGHAGSDS